MQFSSFIVLALPMVGVLAAPVSTNNMSALNARAVKKPITKPTPVKPAPAPAPVIPKPAPVVPKPEPVVPKPAPVAPKPEPAAPKPAPVAPKPAPSAPAAEKPKPPTPSSPADKPNPAAPSKAPTPSSPADKPNPAAPSKAPTPSSPADRNKPAPSQAPQPGGGSGGGAMKWVGQAVTAAVQGAVTDAITTQVTAGALKAFNMIKDSGDWTKAREQFTQATTKEMFAANPDAAKFAAAICYNGKYTVATPAGVEGKTSVEMTSTTGALKATYECFYMTAPNTFTAQGDGGFINLAIQSSSRCSFAGKVLKCT